MLGLNFIQLLRVVITPSVKMQCYHWSSLFQSRETYLGNVNMITNFCVSVVWPLHKALHISVRSLHWISLLLFARLSTTSASWALIHHLSLLPFSACNLIIHKEWWMMNILNLWSSLFTYEWCWYVFKPEVMKEFLFVFQWFYHTLLEFQICRFIFVLRWFDFISKHIVALNNEKDNLYCENLDRKSLLLTD